MFLSTALDCPVPVNKQCFTFNNQCTSDAVCAKGYKCCLQPGCGLECQKGVTATGPKCPQPENKQCFAYKDQCTSDAACAPGTKCCLQPGCGLECKAVVY